MDKRYTIFVSSTYTDMIEERNAVIQAIMRQGHIPLGMEAFGAANASSWKVITKTIDASDYYVLLIARRYGSINEAVDLGYTEQEFQYAVQKGIPVLVFLLDDTAPWPGNYSDTDVDAVRRLKAFRNNASKDRQVAFWKSKADLPMIVMTSLGNAFSDFPMPGWVRPDETLSPAVAEEMARLVRERDILKLKVENGQTTFGGEPVNQIIRVLTDEGFATKTFRVRHLNTLYHMKISLAALFMLACDYLEYLRPNMSAEEIKYGVGTRLIEKTMRDYFKDDSGNYIGKIAFLDYRQDLQEPIFFIQQLGLIQSSPPYNSRTDAHVDPRAVITPIGRQVRIELLLRQYNFDVDGHTIS